MSELLERLRKALADRYLIEEEVGSGGMAVVYRARDLKHGRTVALKVLRPELAPAIGKERFLSEIQITASLDHPHIVPLLDSGESGGFVFFTMPFVQGETLRERLDRERRIPVAESMRIAGDVASALDYAHRRGIVHRDVKPSNVFLQSGHARVADFGIAYAAGEAAGERLTATGLSVGTPAYMSPEQAIGGRELDGRSDLYSLACVAYEMLAGAPPFSSSSSRTVLAKHLNEVPRPVTSERPEAGRSVASALTKALQKLPEDRQTTVAEFVADLEHGTKVPRRVARSWKGMVLPLMLVSLVGAGAWILGRATGGVDARDGAEEGVLIDPDRIAIFPLRVASADTSLNRFASEIGTLLEFLFNGETGPRAVDQVAVLRAWDELTESDTLGPTAAELRSTAAGMGAGQTLTGTISGSASLVQIVAWVENTVNGQLEHRASVRGSSQPDSVLRIVDELGVRLAGLNAGEPRDRIRHVLSTSAEARTAYLAATRARRNGEYREARDYYEIALEHDSTFALAALGLVNNMWWYKPSADFSYLQAMRIAWTHRNRLPPVDSLLLVGHGGSIAIDPLGNDRARELEAWRLAVALAPSRYEALNGLGDQFLHHGAVVGVADPADSAWRYLTRAFDSDTIWGEAHSEVLNHLVDLAIARRDSRALMLYMPHFLRSEGAGELAHSLLAARISGDQTATDSLTSELHENPKHRGEVLINEAPFLRMGFVEADYVDAATEPEWEAPLRYKYALVRGRPRRAERYATYPVVEIHDGALERRDRDMVLDALYAGADQSLGEAAASRLSSRLSSDVDLRGDWLEASEDACALAMWQLGHRWLDDARATIETLRNIDLPEERRITSDDLLGKEMPAQIQLDAVNRTYPALCRSTVEAWLAALADPATRPLLLEEIDAEMQRGPMPWSAPYALHRRHLNLGLARAWEAAGEPRQALAAVRRRDEFLTFHSTLARSLRDEGHLAAAVGDTAGAIHAYEYYLELRSDPEPELLAEVEEVRMQLEKLR